MCLRKHCETSQMWNLVTLSSTKTAILCISSNLFSIIWAYNPLQKKKNGFGRFRIVVPSILTHSNCKIFFHSSNLKRTKRFNILELGWKQQKIMQNPSSVSNKLCCLNVWFCLFETHAKDSKDSLLRILKQKVIITFKNCCYRVK